MCLEENKSEKQHSSVWTVCISDGAHLSRCTRYHGDWISRDFNDPRRGNEASQQLSDCEEEVWRLRWPKSTKTETEMCFQGHNEKHQGLLITVKE